MDAVVPEVLTQTWGTEKRDNRRIEKLVRTTMVDLIAVYEESTKKIVTEFKMKRQDGGEWNAHITLLYDPLAEEGK